MRALVEDPRRLLAWASPLRHGLHDVLAAGTKHTGLPAVVVAAILLVASYRIARQAVRFAFHVAIVAALLAWATRLGWLSW